jgi:hypothetical protein
MTDRRFNDDEVAAIFERATEARPTNRPHASSSEGMTLAQLQDIGREVGITPDAIARAALTLSESAPRPARKMLGLPVGVERTVELGRELSDAEWERLVVDLRETFDARGRTASEGGLRAWTNGNLQALIEPSANGYRLRLRTFKGSAPGQLVGGLAMLGSAGFLAALAVLKNATGDTGMMMAIAAAGAMGLAMAGSAIASLPRWARLRQTQMTEVATRLIERTTSSSERP